MIRFDYQAAETAFIKMLVKNLKALGKVAVKAMVSALSGVSDMPSEWADDVADNLKVNAEFNPGEILVEIGFIDSDDAEKYNALWKAMVINYGVGQLMSSSKENPWLKEWLTSDDYNKARNKHSKVILTRPGEEVYDPYTGGYKQSQALSVEEIPQFAHSPNYWFENAIERFFNDTRIDEAINDSINQWGDTLLDYIKVD